MPLTEHEDWWADPTEYRVVSEADFRRWWAAAATDAESREAIDRYDRQAEEARWVSADSL